MMTTVWGGANRPGGETTTTGGETSKWWNVLLPA